MCYYPEQRCYNCLTYRPLAMEPCQKPNQCSRMERIDWVPVCDDCSGVQRKDHGNPPDSWGHKALSYPPAVKAVSSRLVGGSWTKYV